MLKNKIKAAVVLSILSGAFFVHKQQVNAAIRKAFSNIMGAASSSSRAASNTTGATSNVSKNASRLGEKLKNQAPGESGMPVASYSYYVNKKKNINQQKELAVSSLAKFET